MEFFFGVILIVLGIALYFVPWIVAACRNGKHCAGIAILNLFLGWTFIGWVIALVWATSDSRAEASKEEGRHVEVKGANF